MADDKFLIEEIVSRYKQGIENNLPSCKLGLAKDRGKMITTIYVEIDDRQYTVTELQLVDTIGDELGREILGWILR